VGEQYTGGTGDGVYAHCALCGVYDRLDKHYGMKGVPTTDKMHRAATVDTKLRNPKAEHNIKQNMFIWGNEVTLTISKAIMYVNWGKEWYHFFEVCKIMILEGYETQYKSPKLMGKREGAGAGCR
jgi:hypothetical protein